MEKGANKMSWIKTLIRHTFALWRNTLKLLILLEVSSAHTHIYAQMYMPKYLYMQKCMQCLRDLSHRKSSDLTHVN